MTKIDFPTNIFPKLVKLSIVLSCTMLLSSCGAKFEKFVNGDINKYSDAEFGSYDKDYKEKITYRLTSSAKNPDSIQIRSISEPRKVLIQNTNVNALWKPYFPGYGICAEYSGTNSYGATLVQRKSFYFKDGKLVSHAIIPWKGYDPCAMEKVEKDLSKYKADKK